MLRLLLAEDEEQAEKGQLEFIELSIDPVAVGEEQAKTGEKAECSCRSAGEEAAEISILQYAKPVVVEKLQGAPHRGDVVVGVIAVKEIRLPMQVVRRR